MATPVAEWDEEYVLALPREDDELERKGPKLLDLSLPKVDEDTVRDELAKQLSAFANSGGGKIIYGLSNSGKVEEGGVSQTVKGRRTTKEWLEDVIPGLTDYEILGVKVHEVCGTQSGSTILPGKALYIVEVPDSGRVPHQSKRDMKYYVRLGGNSQPAPHRMIEDIRNRTRHPNLVVSNAEVSLGARTQQTDGTTTAKVNVTTKLVIMNIGRIMATHTCVEMEYVPSLFSLRNTDPSSAIDRRGARKEVKLFEIPNPIYPEMQTAIRFVWELTPEIILSPDANPVWRLSGLTPSPENLRIPWKIFADSAPPNSGEVRLGDLGFSEKFRELFKNKE